MTMQQYQIVQLSYDDVTSNAVLPMCRGCGYSVHGSPQTVIKWRGAYWHLECAFKKLLAETEPPAMVDYQLLQGAE